MCYTIISVLPCTITVNYTINYHGMLLKMLIAHGEFFQIPLNLRFDLYYCAEGRGSHRWRYFQEGREMFLEFSSF